MTGVTCGAGTATTYGRRVFFSLFVYALRVSVSAIFRLYVGTNELFAILTVSVCLFLVCICFAFHFIYKYVIKESVHHTTPCIVLLLRTPVC